MEMTPEIHVTESLPAYALSCLDEEEARLVVAHLAGCVICRQELAAYQVVTDQLALAVPDAAPPPGLQRQLLARVQSLPAIQQTVPPMTRRPYAERLRRVWGTAAVLLLLAVVIMNVLLWQGFNRREFLTGPLGMRAIALTGNEAVPQASAFVIISADGEHGVLVVDAMPQLNPEQQYQLWLARNGQYTSGGLFAVDESGYRGVRITVPESLLSYTAVLITIEPAEGSSTPTGTPIMDGLLPNPD